MKTLTHLPREDKAVIEAFLQRRFEWIGEMDNEGFEDMFYESRSVATDYNDWSISVDGYWAIEYPVYNIVRLGYKSTGDTWIRYLRTNYFLSNAQSNRVIDWAIALINKAQFKSTQCEGQLSLFTQ